MADTWTYDGGGSGFSDNGVCSVMIDDAVPGDKYMLLCDDSDSSAVTVTAVGTSLTVTVTDIGDTAGFSFCAFLFHGSPSTVNSNSDVAACNVFVVGTASTTGLNTPVTWAYDGTTGLSITFTAASGISYRLGANSAGAFQSVSGGPYTPGSTQILSLTVTAPSPAGKHFYGQFVESGGGGNEFADRIFVDGVAGTGAPGNPGGSPPPPAALVLVQSPPWRFVIADIVYNGSSPPGFATLAFLDRRATNRQLRYELRQAATCSGRVSADDPEINIVHTDGEPLLAEGVRVLIGLRREGGTPPWVPRFAGPILQANRTVQEDTPYVDFTAFSPRQLLYKRPVRKADGLLLGKDGLTFRAQRGNVILLALLARTEAADGPTFIDTTTGTIEDTDPIDINFQQGSSVGEALDALEQTGTLDALLPAVYDPVGSPGILAQLNVHILAGSIKREAIMAWDLPGRTLVGIDWLEDGGQRENNVELYTADGLPTPIQSDGTSVAKFGSYWGQQNYPAQTQLDAVTTAAIVRLLTQKDHPSTLNLDPSPQRADPPLSGYGLADWLPTYASKRLGKAIDGGTHPYRVYAIALDLLDDATETTHLRVSQNVAPA